MKMISEVAPKHSSERRSFVFESAHLKKPLRAFGPGFSYLQQTEGALDEAAVRVHVLAELSLQDGLLLRHQAQRLSRGGQQQLGVRAETRIWTTQTLMKSLTYRKLKKLQSGNGSVVFTSSPDNSPVE